jgi:SWI/SNF-related matrix-associated actin-dependent regulator 1 of chromatin subfamily A
MIVDEAHLLSNRKSKRAIAMMKLSKKIDKIVALTGTPIENHTKDIWTILNILDNKVFSSYWRFVELYCGIRWDGQPVTTPTEHRLAMLNKLLVGRYMIRRLKKDVLKELPDKTRSIIPMEIDKKELKIYNDMLDAELVEMTIDGQEKKFDMNNFLSKIEALKQQIWLCKRESVFAFIDEMLESGIDKIVIFAVHKKVISELIDHYGEFAVKIDGSVSMESRAEAVDKFQNDASTKIFIGQLKSAGVGITLTASSRLIHLELGWNPGIMSQAEDRIHRIGQKDCANIYYLIAPDTIEFEIMELIDQKFQTIAQAIDGWDADKIESGLLKTLYNKMLSRRKNL